MKNFWNVVSAIAAILAVGVAVFVFFYSRTAESKRIEVELVSRSVLVDESVTRSGRPVEVLYAGRKIPNFAIIQCRVSNVGRKPIQGADYEKPITLAFSNITEVLSAEQTASDPSGLVIQATVIQNSIELSKALLNPGDWFNLEIGVVPLSGHTPTLEPKGRIAGVKRIELRESISEPSTGEKGSEKYKVITWVQAVLVLVAMLSQMIITLKRYRSR